MEYQATLAKLLYLVLRSINFNRLRLYIIDRQQHISILRCAVDIDKGSVDTSSLNVYRGLYRIEGLHLYKLHNIGLGYDPDLTDYKDFIARFKYDDVFSIDLTKLRTDTIPLPVQEFHEYYKVRNIAVVSIWENDQKRNFFGYIAADKGESLLTPEDLNLLYTNIELISKTIVAIVNNQESISQQKKLIEKSDELIKKMKKDKYDIKELINYLFEIVFEVCPESDIVQIKQVFSTKNDHEYKCKYWYARINPLSVGINDDNKKLVESLNNKEYLLTESTDWVTVSVYEERSAKFIPNMRLYPDKYNVDKVSDEKDARAFIRKRNNSEINIPFRIGNEISGVLDVHGRRPYSLNENTMHVLRDIALWFGVILTDIEQSKYVKRLDESVGFDYSMISNAIKRAVPSSIIDKNKIRYIDDGNVQKMFEKNVYTMGDVYIDINCFCDQANQINVDAKYYDNRSVNVINNYFHNNIIYADGSAKYKTMKRFAKYMYIISWVMMPFSFVTEIGFIIPLLPLMGIIFSASFYKMASVGFKEFKGLYERNKGSYEHNLPDFLKNQTSLEEIIKVIDNK